MPYSFPSLRLIQIDVILKNPFPLGKLRDGKGFLFLTLGITKAIPDSEHHKPIIYFLINKNFYKNYKTRFCAIRKKKARYSDKSYRRTAQNKAYYKARINLC